MSDHNPSKDWYDFVPPNEALDYKPSSYAALYFKTDDPEGKQRMRECLDASKLRAVLWNLVHGPDGIFHALDRADDRFADALMWTLERINDLCDKYNIDLED